MNVFVDIDGTIADTPGIEYDKATPIAERIAKINAMYDRGDRITYWTARGTLSGKNFGELTREQLQAWGCKYHALIFGKPAFDLFIDDKVMNAVNL